MVTNSNSLGMLQTKKTKQVDSGFSFSFAETKIGNSLSSPIFFFRKERSFAIRDGGIIMQ